MVALMVLALVAMVAGAFMVTEDDPGPRVLAASFVSRGPTDDQLSTAASNSPSVARNPVDARNVVVSYRVDSPGYSAGLRWSGDGGRTWTGTELPLPADIPACAASPDGTRCPFAPDIAFSADGTLYVAYVHLVGNGNRPDALWLAKSPDGGRTLLMPKKVAGPLTFGVRLAIDPAGPLHLVWLQAHETSVGGFAQPYPSVVAATSTDGGATFSPPANVSDSERERVTAGDAVVDSGGNLVVVYRDLKDNRRDFENLAGPPWEGASALVFTRSTDGGATFSPGAEVESGVVGTHRFLVFIPETPSLAAGPDGRLYLAWSDGRNGSDDVFLRTSADSGSTWSPATRVNDNPVGDGTAQFLPAVTAGPGKHITVVFLDGRLDPAGRVFIDAFLATGTSNGLNVGKGNFENARLSTRSFSSRIGPSLGDDYGTDFGTGLGIATAGGEVMVAWVDTRLGSETSGNQEVAFAAVDPTEQDWIGLEAWVLVAAGIGVTVLAARGVLTSRQLVVAAG